jgi:hypothetical protein
MVITIAAGPREGKSGTAYWLAEQLKKHGADRVVITDDETTEEQAALVRENYENIVKLTAKAQEIKIVTKLKTKNDVDTTIADSNKGAFSYASMMESLLEAWEKSDKGDTSKMKHWFERNGNHLREIVASAKHRF